MQIPLLAPVPMTSFNPALQVLKNQNNVPPHLQMFLPSFDPIGLSQQID
jgi:hypothetical protein